MDNSVHANVPHQKNEHLANGKVHTNLEGHQEHPKVFLAESGDQVDTLQTTKKSIFKNGSKNYEEKTSERSSRPSSRTWKAATKVVIANNRFMKEATDRKKEIRRVMEGSNAYIPVFPLPLSVACMIFNFVIPGSVRFTAFALLLKMLDPPLITSGSMLVGTMLSSFLFFCVGTTYDQTDRSQIEDKVFGIALVNFSVGMAQLFTTTFLLVGWFWSVSRGITMVYLALEADEQ